MFNFRLTLSLKEPGLCVRVNICIEKDFEKLIPISEQWNKLVEKNQTHTIFQTYEWHQCWWDIFKENHELFMVLVEEKGELVGIAPLMMIKEKAWCGNRRVLQFIGTGMSDYCDFILKDNNPAVIKKIMEYLFQNKSRWDQMKLAEIPEKSESIKVIENFCKKYNGHGTFFVRDSICPSLVIRNNQQNARVISNKTSLRRRQKYFMNQGQYEVFHLTDSRDILNYLKPFFEQHICRWENSGTPSLFSRRNNKLFFEALVKKMCMKKWIIFTVIRSKGITIAFHFGFDYNNVILWYKPTYNPAFSRHSPGQVLLKELLDYAIAEQKDEFDFTVGNEPFKKRFSNRIRKNQTYCIFQSAAEFRIEQSLNFMRRIRGYVVKSVKATRL